MELFTTLISLRVQLNLLTYLSSLFIQISGGGKFMRY